MKRSICTLLSAWLLSGCGDTPSDQQPSDAAGPARGRRGRRIGANTGPAQPHLDHGLRRKRARAPGRSKTTIPSTPIGPESTSRTGYNFVFEPLYFYNAFKGKLIPWIATDHRFNDVYTEVEITIRPGVHVERRHAVDGARRGLYDQHAAKHNAPLLSYSTDMKNWVQEAVVVDSLTARIVADCAQPALCFFVFHPQLRQWGADRAQARVGRAVARHL